MSNALSEEEELILQALRVPPCSRSQAHKDQILQWARTQAPLQRLETQGQQISLAPLTEAMEVVDYPSQAIIFEQGEPGDAYYLVFAGEVGMLPKSKHEGVKVPPPTEEQDAAADGKKNRSRYAGKRLANKRLSVTAVHSEEGDEEEAGEETKPPTPVERAVEAYKFPSRKVYASDCVAIATKGGAFGEVSLLHGVARSLSVVALAGTLLVKIARVAYLKVADAEGEKERAKAKQKLIRDALPAGHEWTPVRLRRLAYEFQDVETSKGSVLQKQGSPPTTVWVVCDGEVRVQVRGDVSGRPVALALCERGVLLGELRQDSVRCSYSLVVMSAKAALVCMSRDRFFTQLERQGTIAVEASFARQLSVWREHHDGFLPMESGANTPEGGTQRSARAAVSPACGHRLSAVEALAAEGGRGSRVATPRSTATPRCGRDRWDPGAANFGIKSPRLPVVPGHPVLPQLRMPSPRPPMQTMDDCLFPMPPTTPRPPLTPRHVSSPSKSPVTKVSPLRPNRLESPSSAVALRRGRLLTDLMLHQFDVGSQLPALPGPTETLSYIDAQVLNAALGDPDVFTKFSKRLHTGYARLGRRGEHQTAADAGALSVQGFNFQSSSRGTAPRALKH